MTLLDLLKKIINEEFVILKETIINNIISQGANASGRTIDSLEIQEFENGVQLLGRAYFSTITTGRKAGKIPYNFIDKIKEWAQNKQGLQIDPIPYKRQESENFKYRFTPQERGLNKFAGAVAYSIEKHGSFLKKYGYEIEIYQKAINETIERIKNRVITEIRQFIINDLNTII